MAVIPGYDRQQTLSGGSAPNPVVSDALGNAVQNIGGSISNVAQMLQEKQTQKEDFNAANGKRLLDLQLGQGLEDQAQNIAPDGAAFHDDYMRNVYQPQRDAFLAGLPPRLRDKYQTILADNGPDHEEWSIKAATTERDQSHIWYNQQLDESQQQRATQIARDGSSYDRMLRDGYAEIDSAPLPTAVKIKRKADWEQLAMSASLGQQMEQDPEGVLKRLGADPRHLSPTTQFEAIKKALITQESGGDGSQISPKGATGLMQVMPGTARDIAKEMNDPDFNPKWDPQQITQYLSNDVVNQRYGDFYLKKMIRTYGGQGGLEAALIGYNGGPARAEAWIKSGFDDSVLPAETKNYYKSIMAKLPGLAGSGNKGDPSSVHFVFGRRGQTAIAGQTEDHLNPDLASRVKTSFAALGLDKVRINSGYRSPADNARVGGAEHSQHLKGNAVDIDVAGYSVAERVQIIKTLSANGITGLGIGANIIHADIGGRRAWGYSNGENSGPIPKWAQAAIADHLANRSTAPAGGIRKTEDRYAHMTYADRQRWIASADQAVTQRYNENTKATALQKVQLSTAMDNEAASLTKTGQSTGFDDTQVATVLGEDDYLKWSQRKQQAVRTFNATDGIGQMTIEQMGDRVQDYNPIPGSPTYASDVQVQAAVQKEVDRVTRQRAQSPAEAAMAYPDVKAAYAKVQGGIQNGGNVNPDDMQAFVATMLNRQKEFNLKPGSEAPIPKDWSMQIGQTIAKRIPELGGSNLETVRAALVVQYKALEQVFGPYTDEVIMSALADYKGIGPNTAELITNVMGGIASGKSIDALAGPRVTDQDQVESTTMFGRAWNAAGDALGSGVDWAERFYYGDKPPADANAPEPAVSASPAAAPRAWQSEQRVGALNLTPQEQHLYEHHIDNLNNGKFVRNEDGSVSTVYQTTVEIKGRTYNFPTVWDGKILPVREAVERAIKEHGLSYWPSYKTEAEAEARYSAMHDVIEGDVNQLSEGDPGSNAQTQSALSDELILRTISDLNSADTPEEEAAVVARRGQAAVDAAKMRIAGGRQ